MERKRQNLITFSLEIKPRPGAHEIRVRPTPSGVRIRNGRNVGYAD